MRDVNRPDRINPPLITEDTKTEETLAEGEPPKKKRRTKAAVVVPVGELALTSKDNLLLNPSNVAATSEGAASTTPSQDGKSGEEGATSDVPTNAPVAASKATAGSGKEGKPSTVDLTLTYTTRGGTIVEGITPHDHDVLFGRGAYVNAHPGNRLLRSLALERKDAFEAGVHNEKRKLAVEIVRHMQSLDPPARFLAPPPKPGERTVKCNAEVVANCDVWVDVGEERAVHKATQVMRDLKRPDRIAPGWTKGETGNSNDTQMLRVIATTVASSSTTSAEKEEKTPATGDEKVESEKETKDVVPPLEPVDGEMSSANIAAEIAQISGSTEADADNVVVAAVVAEAAGKVSTVVESAVDAVAI